jgi:dihydroorotase
VTLARETWTIPAEYALGEQALIPLNAGATMHWRVIS